MSEQTVTTWIKIEDELPPIGKWVWFRCSDPEDSVWFYEPEVGRYEGDKTLGDAIAMETLPKAYKSDWYPCEQWTRDKIVDGKHWIVRFSENLENGDLLWDE